MLSYLLHKQERETEERERERKREWWRGVFKEAARRDERHLFLLPGRLRPPMQARRATANRRGSNGEVRSYVRSSKPRFNWTGELRQLFDEAMSALGGPRSPWRAPFSFHLLFAIFLHLHLHFLFPDNVSFSDAHNARVHPKTDQRSHEMPGNSTLPHQEPPPGLFTKNSVWFSSEETEL